ncbi:hypothetical protein [Micromonospora viridifaciens]|uniref:hypothetical protein n=1 Tax=Micromonospora viridifaciens TaxID=1881 RepID=UPI000B5AF81B|nr:hypothetical protein [Micromonospora viridifaciens]
MTTSEVALPPVPARRRGLAAHCFEGTATIWRRRRRRRPDLRPLSRRPALRPLSRRPALRSLSRRSAPTGTSGTVTG